MVLDCIGFKQGLRDARDCTSQSVYAELDERLNKVAEEDRDALREEFLLDERIMKARTYGEIKDIPLEKILSCIGSHGLFFDLYDREKAGYYFHLFSRVKKLRTSRKRRIL